MKILLIYPLNQDEPSLIGLHKKMHSQVAAFQRCVDADYVCFGYHKVYFNGNELCKFKSYPKGLNFINYYNNFYKYLLKHIDFNQYSSIIIRYPMTNPFFLTFLKKVKKTYGKKIIIEIPTFPYENEGVNLKRKMILRVDRMYRTNLKKYVDLIITHYGQKEIFGIPCYHMGNGIEVSPHHKMKMRPKMGDEIRLLGLGNLSFYHGFDRVIRGLENYYQSNPSIKVYFDIVGMGEAYDSLKKLVEATNTSKYITFYGVKHGDELQGIIDKSHIGVSTLAWHRAGVTYDGSLKSREYTLQSLPFITCAEDADFTDFPFRLVVGLKDDAVDIDSVLSFYTEIVGNEHFEMKMFNYAKDNLSWDVKINKFVQNCLQ